MGVLDCGRRSDLVVVVFGGCLFRNNNMGPEGSAAVGASLRHLTSLQTLDLRYVGLVKLRGWLGRLGWLGWVCE